jgi:minor extracellular serine protease Vpr
MGKLKPFFLTLAILLIISGYAGNIKISPNTAHFLTVLKENNLTKMNKQFYIKRIDNVNYINAFIRLGSQGNKQSLTNLGVQINSVIGDVVTARIPVQNLDSVSTLASVKYIQVGTKVKKRMDIARSASNVDAVQSGTDLSESYTGKNVIIGIIDNGFQYDHINFYTSDGTKTRIKRIWDQNITGTPPTGYTYGTEYTTQAAMFAAKNDFTTETHATHVTGIAAGSDKNNSNTYYGVAPDADLVLVSYNQNDNSTDNVSITDGIKYIYDYATSVSKPCVVNMSLGSHYGPHDGTSIFDQLCDTMEGSGRLLVGAVGNEGTDSLHLSKTFTSNTDTLKSFFKFYDSAKLYGQADIWGEANKNFSVKAVVYRKSTGSIVYSTQLQNAATSSNATYTLRSGTMGVNGKIYIYTERNSQNDKPNAFVYIDLTNIESGYYVGIVVTASDGSTVHAWTDDSYTYFSSNSISGWTTGDSNNSMGEIGGTGKKIISVGAYTTKESVTNIKNVSYGASQTYGKLATFSSHGPTLDNRVKPDITAPGTLLVSSFSSAVLNNSDYSNYFVKKNTVNGVDYYYGMMQGTSMSTPFVTGVLATWLGVDSSLNPAQVRSILQSTSITDTYTGTIATGGSNYWGFGKIDAWNGIKACVQLAAQNNVTSNIEVKIYPNPCTDSFSLLFTSNDSNVYVTISTINGQQIEHRLIGTVAAAEEININVSTFPTGIYLVSFSGKKQYKAYKLLKN